MPPEEKNLAKLENLIKLLDEQVTKEDFTKAFEQVLNLVVQIEKRTADAIAQLEKTYATLMDKMQSNHVSAYSDLKGQVDHVFVGDKINEIKKQHDSKMAEVDKKIANIKDGYTPIKGKDYFDGKSIKGDSGSPDTKQQILEKLRNIPVDMIEGLREELDKIKKEAKRVPYVVGGSAGGGRIVRSYDFSSSLNGVLKTFSLPAFWRVISVHSSSFPDIFRETVDWTSDASAMTITFTSQIDESTVLASGQSIVVIYSEA